MIGVVKGVGNGKTTISATVGNITGSTSVTVTIAMYSISPANTTVPLDATKQLKFLYTIGDRSDDLTASSAWSSSNTAIATVSRTGGVTPVAKGTVTITADSGGNRASATVGVTNPSHLVLKVAPIGRIDKGGTGQLTAMYTDTNGATQDVTASATWASANPVVASVTNGTVSGLSDGTTTIRATYGDVSASVSVDVVTRPLSGHFISPCNPSINVGSSRALSFYYVYPEGYTSDYTGRPWINWSSSNPSVASVSGGTVTGVALGQATITADYGGSRATVVVTVVSSGANSWNLAQCNPTIPVGAVRQLTFKSPDNSFDATSSAKWSSSNTAIVTVDRGTIKGVSAGQATTADYEGNRISTTVTVQ
jgi:trimeric autotransporter adhesin